MLEIRNDDVLQVGWSSFHHYCRLLKKTSWEWFLEADKIFEEYNYPCTLVVLADGIDKLPHWVEHIKKNQHRYKIELHGSSHHRYDKMTAEEGLKDLQQARKKIEKTFNIKIENWIVPYGKRSAPDWGEEVCKKMGIGYVLTRGNNKYRVFHYWHEGQVDKVKRLIKWLQTQENN